MDESATLTDTESIEEMILEYFKFHGLEKTYKKFEADRKKRAGKYQDPPQNDGPVLNAIWDTEAAKEEKEIEKEKSLKELQRQHCSVLQSARQIFSIAIN